MITKIVLGFFIIIGTLLFIIVCLQVIGWIEDEFDGIF